jgi:hypothetical protein
MASLACLASAFVLHSAFNTGRCLFVQPYIYNVLSSESLQMSNCKLQPMEAEQKRLNGLHLCDSKPVKCS